MLGCSHFRLLRAVRLLDESTIARLLHLQMSESITGYRFHHRELTPLRVAAVDSLELAPVPPSVVFNMQRARNISQSMIVPSRAQLLYTSEVSRDCKNLLSYYIRIICQWAQFKHSSIYESLLRSVDTLPWEHWLLVYDTCISTVQYCSTHSQAS